MLHFGSSRRLSIDVDTIATALCISTNGYGHEEDFRFYSDGITRVRNFIHTERYNMIGAVRDAAKAAYAAACALNKIATPQRYNPRRWKNWQQHGSPPHSPPGSTI